MFCSWSAVRFLFGQCIMSSILGGRSGNRGCCAQTCRLPYELYRDYDKVDEGYLMSPKDIETLEILPQLIEAGINSLQDRGQDEKSRVCGGSYGHIQKNI